MLEVNNKPNNFVDSLMRELKSDLDKEMDQIIDQKVEEVRQELTMKKNELIVKLLTSIEIATNTDMYGDGVDLKFSLRYKY